MSPIHEFTEREPAAVTAPLCSQRPLADAADPLALCRELPAGPGRLLLQSAAAPPGEALPTTRRSLLLTRALLHVELRGTRLRVQPLRPEAEPLLELLAARLPAAAADGKGLAAELHREVHRPGLDDDAVLRSPSVLDGLRAAASLLGDAGAAGRRPQLLAPGLFGALSYELVDHFEALPARRPDPLDEPDVSMVLAADFVVWDHRTGQAQVLTRGLPWEGMRDARQRHEQTMELLARRTAPPELSPAPAAPLPATCDLDGDAYCRGVERLLEHIAAGDVFQAVLSRGFRMASRVDPLRVYGALSTSNPSPYMFYLDLPDGALLGASPETFLRVEDGEVEIRPIAGTVPRGLRSDGSVDAELDGRLALSLLLDRKEQAEHAMLLDLARNDVARVSAPGSTRVTQQFAVEKYSHVQHLVSRVRGRLRQGLDALHAYRAAANMGTLTGAPKVRAMELVRELEPGSRGFYGGAVGYLLQDGSMDSCIAIRSLRCKDGEYHCRAGAGIVWASRPERELQETEDKAQAVREALAAADAVEACS